MRTKLRGKFTLLFMTCKFTLLFMTCAVLLALPAMAFADQIANNVDATVDATAEVMALSRWAAPMAPRSSASS